MAVRPINLYQHELRATLEGRQSQLRRVVGPSACTVLGERFPRKLWSGLKLDRRATKVRTRSTLMQAIAGDEAPYDLHLDVPWIHPEDEANGQRWEDDQCMYRVRPIIEPGDLLWVRESVQADERYDEDDRIVRYIADGHEQHVCGPHELDGAAFGDWWLLSAYRATDPDLDGCKIVPPIHMPRWASRLTLSVTDVRVQRVQEISPEDAEAEGIDMDSGHAHLCVNVQGAGYPNDLPRGSAEVAVFKCLWDSINAKRGYGWDVNPWVVAVTFAVHRCNVDQMPISKAT